MHFAVILSVRCSQGVEDPKIESGRVGCISYTMHYCQYWWINNKNSSTHCIKNPIKSKSYILKLVRTKNNFLQLIVLVWSDLKWKIVLELQTGL
jgi:hypothetical protein